MKTENLDLMAKPIEEQNISDDKALMLRKAFDPMLNTLDSIEEEYQSIIKMEINTHTCKLARELRLRLVKVRTGTAGVHKEQKAEVLRLGRAIDGIKNVVEFAVVSKEDELEKIETYFERMVEQERELIRVERTQILAQFEGVNPEFYDLANMEPELFEKLVSDQTELKEFRLMKEQKAEADRKEAERIAIEQAEIDRKQRLADELERKLAEEKRAAEMKEIALKNELLEKQAKEAQAKIEAERKEADEKIRLATEKLEKTRKEAEKKRLDELKAIQEKATAERLAAEKQAKEAAEKQKALEDQLHEKQLAEFKAKQEAEAKIQAELSMADKPKMVALLQSIEDLKTKYTFKAAKYNKLQESINELLDKTVIYANSKL